MAGHFDALTIRQHIDMLLMTGIKEDDAYLPVIQSGKITKGPVEQMSVSEGTLNP